MSFYSKNPLQIPQYWCFLLLFILNIWVADLIFIPVFHPLIFHAWWNTIINMKQFTSIIYICRPSIGPKYLTEKYVLFMELTRQFSMQYSKHFRLYQINYKFSEEERLYGRTLYTCEMWTIKLPEIADKSETKYWNICV
jgi:hypothetical protein